MRSWRPPVMILAALALTPNHVVGDDERATVDVVSLGGSVYLLRNNTPFSNPSSVASVGPDGVFLVDAGLSATFDGFNPRPNFVKNHQWITLIYNYYLSS